MKMNRIQFQPGMSFDQLHREYGTERQCQAALELRRWPTGFHCPKCHSKRHGVYWRNELKIFQCRDCRTQTTLTEGTIFHSTKLPLTKWFQAIYVLTQTKNNVASLELMRFIGVCYKTAWRVKHKIMQMQHERELTTKLSGRVEVDDAYLGGELPGGKAGRGSENKEPFVAAVQTNDNGHPLYAVFYPVTTFSREEIASFARQSLVSGTTVVSDGLWCFKAVEDAGCFHEREVVGKKRKSTDMDCFTWVNTILGNLKTAITGTYHHFNFDKYRHRYLSEYQYRFNRRFDLAGMFVRLLTAAVQTGKRPEAWLRLAEDWR